MDKEKFLHLALKSFKQGGYLFPSLPPLLQKSGWSKGMFYAAFDSKKKFNEALAQRAAKKVLSPMIKAIDLGDNAVDQLQTFIEKSLGLKSAPLLKNIIMAKQNKMLEDILYQGQKEKLFIKNIDKEVQTHLIMNALLGESQLPKKIGISRRTTGLLSLVLMGIEKKQSPSS